MFLNRKIHNFLRPSFSSFINYKPNCRYYCTPPPLSKKQQLKALALSEGSKIRSDFQSVTGDFCKCPSPALRHVSFAHAMVDILRIARRYRDPVVLALEVADKGSRLFMAAHREHLFHYLCHLRLSRPQHSTWHEIMTGLTKMRLYFDLEYYRETNPDIFQDEMVAEFRRSIANAIVNYFQWGGARDRIRFLELDSSTDEKFSRHVIVHMRDTDDREIGFESSADLIEFVQGPIMRALTRDGFFVRPLADFQASVPLIDTAAYQDKPGSNFRILGSPKFGRDNVLRLVYDSNYGPIDELVDTKSTDLDANVGQEISTQHHEFQFHDTECSHCRRIFDDSLVAVSKLADQSIDQEIFISEANLDIYRRNIELSSIDIDQFGIECAFYFVIEQFRANSELFGPKIKTDLLIEITNYATQSEFYEDFSNEEKISDAIQMFENFKNGMKLDPIDWDLIYGYAGDLLEIFFVLPEEIEAPAARQLRDDSKMLGIRRGEMRRRVKEVREKYYKLKQQSSVNYEEWESKKQEIIDRKNAPKVEKLRLCMEKQQKFQNSIRARFEELERCKEIDETVRRGVDMALNHSNRLVADYEERIRVLENVKNGGYAVVNVEPPG